MFTEEYEKVCVESYCMVAKAANMTKQQIADKHEQTMCQTLNAYLFKCISNALCDTDLPQCGK